MYHISHLFSWQEDICREIETEICLFIDRNSRRSFHDRYVLVFPPLTSQGRFFIHTLAERNNLLSASIGKDINRRTVVYFPKQSESTMNGYNQKSAKPDRQLYVPRHRRDQENICPCNDNKQSVNRKIMKSEKKQDTSKVENERHSSTRKKTKTKKAAGKVDEINPKHSANMDNITVTGNPNSPVRTVIANNGELDIRNDFHKNIEANFGTKREKTTVRHLLIFEIFADSLSKNLFPEATNSAIKTLSLSRSQTQHIPYMINEYSDTLSKRILNKSFNKLRFVNNKMNLSPTMSHHVEGLANNFVNSAIENAMEILKSVHLYEKKLSSNRNRFSLSQPISIFQNNDTNIESKLNFIFDRTRNSNATSSPSHSHESVVGDHDKMVDNGVEVVDNNNKFVGNRNEVVGLVNKFVGSDDLIGDSFREALSDQSNVNIVPKTDDIVGNSKELFDASAIGCKNIPDQKSGINSLKGCADEAVTSFSNKPVLSSNKKLPNFDESDMTCVENRENDNDTSNNDKSSRRTVIDKPKVEQQLYKIKKSKKKGKVKNANLLSHNNKETLKKDSNTTRSKNVVTTKPRKKDEKSTKENSEETLYNMNDDNEGKADDIAENNSSVADSVDDWEMNFDEQGDRLDDILLNELSSRTGIDDPLIETPQTINYLDFTPKSIDLDDGEFGHILEIFDFSPVLKTQDIFNALKGAGVKDYNLTWVDDTHALAVFSSRSAAHAAMKQYVPVLQMRQVINGSRQSRIKARDFKDSLLPYKARPATSVVVARNLVASSLGLKTNVTPEQRRKERQLLKEAKERKKEKAKMKIDIWENPDG